VHLSSSTFAQAAQIAEQIESLESQLQRFAAGRRLDSGKAEHSKGSTEAQNRIAKKGRLCSS
jgi:hypothetical protein